MTRVRGKYWSSPSSKEESSCNRQWNAVTDWQTDNKCCEHRKVLKQNIFTGCRQVVGLWHAFFEVLATFNARASRAFRTDQYQASKKTTARWHSTTPLLFKFFKAQDSSISMPTTSPGKTFSAADSVTIVTL